MLNKLNQRRQERDDKGFTLIELLVVVVIIGILIAIAIPLYLNYQKGAKNKAAASDTRNAIATIEQFYTDNNTYTAADAGVKLSASNTKSYANGTSSYTIKVDANPSGGDKIYCYDSDQGGSVRVTAAAAAVSTAGDDC